MIKLKIEDKLVTVATCGEADVPVVYFNAFEMRAGWSPDCCVITAMRILILCTLINLTGITI